MELKTVFDVMNILDTERVDLAAYELKNVARILFDQCKEGRDEDAPDSSLSCFEEDCLRFLFL